MKKMIAAAMATLMLLMAGCSIRRSSPLRRERGMPMRS